MAGVLLLGINVYAAPAADIIGYYEGDDGGAYFVRQVGDKIYWFGEDPNGNWANILKGTVSGTKITAQFWDVPKGKAQGMGDISLEIQGNGATLVKVSSSVPFGAKTLKKSTPHPENVNGVPMIKGFPPEMRSRPQGFGGDEQNLTGVWQGDDSAFYYVRQTPTDVVWVAENNQWGGPGGFAQPSFVHVFFGKKINKLITGDWVDLPKGKTNSSGVLGLQLTTPQEMNRVNPTDGIYFNRLWRSLPNSLRGFADLHVHPMVNLAFGGKLIHGGVDIGSLLPADAKCQHNVRAQSIEQALGPDNGTHGSPDFDNPCGDAFRRLVVFGFEKANDALITAGSTQKGMPKFTDYPRWNDISHQKMWVDWIRRSYDGGQRVMVALAVNNATLAAAVSGPGDGPTDDKASADLQIDEIKSFVTRHNDFMEVALTPADIRRIVSSNKMAIILGLEVDNIGDFNTFPTWDLLPPQGKIAMYKAEFNRLFQKGVRYVFPIHVLDNRIGGTAVYEDFFDYSNKRETGHWWDLQCADPADKINYQFSLLVGVVPDVFKDLLSALGGSKVSLDLKAPVPTNCPHVNNLGLDPTIGEGVIKELMKMGMLIDVDHMSQKAVNQVLDIAEKVPGGYPVVSGHTSLRGNGGNENSRTKKQLQRIGMLGGMFGLGSAGVKAPDYLANYLSASDQIGNGRVSFGTDLNGLVKGQIPIVTSIDPMKPLAPQLKACPNIYDAGFVMSKTGDRTWNYCMDGVAHYGMLPDFLKHIYGLPKGDFVQSHIMQNAEVFVEMWERAAKNSKGVN
jgi:microsomal dipeptidase-like Zn-dependent dipeptidase